MHLRSSLFSLPLAGIWCGGFDSHAVEGVRHGRRILAAALRRARCCVHDIVNVERAATDERGPQRHHKLFSD